jgi:hypothetical protein
MEKDGREARFPPDTRKTAEDDDDDETSELVRQQIF